MAKTPKKKSPKEASNIFHSIMAASVKDNPKPKNNDGMEVTEMYHLPFDSQFDWRASMFNLLKENYIEVMVSEVMKYKKTDFDFEWKDNDSILNQCLEDDLLQKIHKKVEESIIKSISGL
jgi:hypothetical protein